MKVLEWSQQISHCKSMQIFYDAQGKLTTQSKVGFTLNLTHPSFMVVLVTVKNEEDPIKNEGARLLEWSQYYLLIFKMLKGS